MVEARICLRKLAGNLRNGYNNHDRGFFPVREDNGEELRWPDCAADKNGLWRSRGYCAQTSAQDVQISTHTRPRWLTQFKLRCNNLLISTKVSPTVRTFKNTLHSKPSLHPIHEALLFHSIHEVTQSQVSTESSELALPRYYSLVATV